jgi:tRNA modification GTPase
MTGAGIGIVRISGDHAIAVADKIFEAKSGIKLSDAKTHTIHYGHIVSDGQVLDEVLVSVMKGPHSYTGEDTAEINCHGGLFVVKKVLDAVLTHGAELSQPGEFTKRAFLNGKIDLSKAEADSYNDDTIDSVVSSARSSCSSQTGCKFDYNYSKGKYLEIILTLDEKYWESKGGSELKNKSADELYSTLKAGHTNGSVDGSHYTCK